jgi:hypothetical protein
MFNLKLGTCVLLRLDTLAYDSKQFAKYNIFHIWSHALDVLKRTVSGSSMLAGFSPPGP